MTTQVVVLLMIFAFCLGTLCTIPAERRLKKQVLQLQKELAYVDSVLDEADAQVQGKKG